MHEETYTELDDAIENWINETNRVVEHSGHDKDDVTPVVPKCNGFTCNASEFFTTSDGRSTYGTASQGSSYGTASEGSSQVASSYATPKTSQSYKKIYPTIEKSIDDWRVLRVEVHQKLNADEQVESLASELQSGIDGLAKSFAALSKQAAVKNLLTPEEQAKIRFASRVINRYEGLSYTERRRFLDTLSNKEISDVFDMVSFVDTAEGPFGMIRDSSMFETMYNEMGKQPVMPKPTSYLGKVIELNGVGPRNRGPTGVSKKIRPFNIRTDMKKKPAPESPDDMQVDDYKNRIEVSGGGSLTAGGKPKGTTKVSARGEKAPEGSLRNLAYKALPRRKSERIQ